MHADRNILIVCHHWSPVPASVSLSPTHLAPVPSFFTPWQFPYLFVSVTCTGSRTRMLMQSPDVTDGLIKCHGWSRLVAWALIESSCLCSDCCYFINPQAVCVYACARLCNYTHWPQLTQAGRLSVPWHSRWQDQPYLGLFVNWLSPKILFCPPKLQTDGCIGFEVSTENQCS